MRSKHSMHSMRSVRPLAFLFAAVALLGAPAAAIEEGPYKTPPAIEILSLMAPAPPVGSAEELRDVDAVLAAQRARTKAQADLAVADAAPSIFRWASALGAGETFTAERFPLTDKFFFNLRRTQSSITGPAKDCFLGPRPFLLDKRIRPIEKLKIDSANAAGTKLADVPRGPLGPCRPAPEKAPEYSYSYPSGHATFGALASIVLARMVPERRDAIFARGWEFGWSRVVAGIHAPSALESSRIVASLIARDLDKDPRFLADFAAAKAELRAGLGLAP